MYIVTGGAGMIGSAMIWELNRRNITDILVVDHLGTSEKWKNLVNRTFAEYMPRDLFLQKITGNALDRPIEGIFHMGACSSTTERDADYLFRNNTEYTKTLVRYALEYGGIGQLPAHNEPLAAHCIWITACKFVTFRKCSTAKFAARNQKPERAAGRIGDSGSPSIVALNAA